MASTTHGKRSMTGHHALLPASRGTSVELFVPLVPTRAFISWTFGRGTVIWRLWPAVLLHTAFAAVVVSISLKTKFQMNLPPVLLTVLGVVIGFVISYRASSGYDRYWMGRTCWSDMVRASRGMGRIIWFHVPPRLTPRTPEEISSGTIKRSEEEMMKVMAEKRMALDLIEGFVVAVKHHVRGELGIYYEDLYHLLRPLHEHYHKESKRWAHDHLDPAAAQSPGKLQVPGPGPSSHHNVPRTQSNSPAAASASALLPVPISTDPFIPSITAYGTFDPAHPSASASRRSSSSASTNSDASDTRPLLPSQLRPENVGIGGMISRDLIPFESLWSAFHGLFKRQPALELPRPNGASNDAPAVEFDWSTPSSVKAHMSHRGTHGKHRPMVAGGGQNLPLTILRCMSEWVSVIDDRGTTYGNPNAALYTYIVNFEDSLSAIERILTTPLPFVYSVHIRHTVWIYLFFLPFQLIDQFGWSTIPGVGIAAFIYLGFLAAGEEIEQPFGYDENDLDLDLFCQEIVHKDIEGLKSTPCLNAYFTHHGEHLAQRSIVETSAKLSVDEQEQDVFGMLQ